MKVYLLAGSRDDMIATAHDEWGTPRIGYMPMIHLEEILATQESSIPDIPAALRTIKNRLKFLWGEGVDSVMVSLGDLDERAYRSIRRYMENLGIEVLEGDIRRQPGR